MLKKLRKIQRLFVEVWTTEYPTVFTSTEKPTAQDIFDHLNCEQEPYDTFKTWFWVLNNLKDDQPLPTTFTSWVINFCKAGTVDNSDTISFLKAGEDVTTDKTQKVSLIQGDFFQFGIIPKAPYSKCCFFFL